MWYNKCSDFVEDLQKGYTNQYSKTGTWLGRSDFAETESVTLPIDESEDFLITEDNKSTYQGKYLEITGDENSNNIDLSNFEGRTTIYAGGGADTIKGSVADDKIYTGVGDYNDTESIDSTGTSIESGAGDDFIRANGKNLTIDGGSGNDDIRVTDRTYYNDFTPSNSTVKGGSGDDTITIKNGANGVTVYGGNDIEGTNSGDDKIILETGGHKNVAYGGDGDDTIEGYGARFVDSSDTNQSDYQEHPENYANKLYGGAGNDTLKPYGTDAGTMYTNIEAYGGEGDDKFIGGNIGGILDGGSGKNSFYYNFSANATILNGGGEDTIYIDDSGVTNWANLTVTQDGNDMKLTLKDKYGRTKDGTLTIKDYYATENHSVKYICNAKSEDKDSAEKIEIKDLKGLFINVSEEDNIDRIDGVSTPASTDNKNIITTKNVAYIDALGGDDSVVSTFTEDYEGPKTIIGGNGNDDINAEDEYEDYSGTKTRRADGVTVWANEKGEEGSTFSPSDVDSSTVESVRMPEDFTLYTDGNGKYSLTQKEGYTQMAPIDEVTVYNYGTMTVETLKFNIQLFFQIIRNICFRC